MTRLSGALPDTVSGTPPDTSHMDLSSESTSGPRAREGLSGVPETATSRRGICALQGCGEWHSYKRTVDGVDVCDAYCDLHSSYYQRYVWMLETEAHDPREPDVRYEPAAVPTPRFYEALEARERRTDLLPAPAPPEGIYAWTDLRSGMTELPTRIERTS